MSQHPFDLLICNGSMPPADVAVYVASGAHSVVCADGGANKARQLHIAPDSIIGDFDSIEQGTMSYYQELGVEFIHLQRQDDTDFEKALKLLRSRGCTNVAVFGSTGGLLDHTLGNLSILQRYIDVMRIVLYDPDFRIDIIRKTTTFRSEPGSRISVVPLQPSAGVRYEGLLYALPLTTLVNGQNEGTCNQSLFESFTVRMETGALMVFREHSSETMTV